MFEPGELVLVKKPFYEKGQGLILPQSDGPYQILKVQDQYGVLLGDPITGEPAYGATRVATARLIKFHYPADWASIDFERDRDQVSNSRELRVGSMVAVLSTRGRQEPRVFLARVESFSAAQEQATVVLFEVPKGERYGPWHRRRWEVKTDAAGAVVKETVPYGEILSLIHI